MKSFQDLEQALKEAKSNLDEAKQNKSVIDSLEPGSLAEKIVKFSEETKVHFKASKSEGSTILLIANVPTKEGSVSISMGMGNYSGLVMSLVEAMDEQPQLLEAVTTAVSMVKSNLEKDPFSALFNLMSLQK